MHNRANIQETITPEIIIKQLSITLDIFIGIIPTNNLYKYPKIKDKNNVVIPLFNILR